MQGEVDIIAKDNEELVFIEVKTRTSKKYVEASEAVNKKKQEHIRKVAKYYLYQNVIQEIKVRFDVIEVYITNCYKKLNHIKQAFE